MWDDLCHIVNVNNELTVQVIRHYVLKLLFNELL